MPGHGGRHGQSDHTDLNGPAMKYALLSDVHANLPALDAVLADIAPRNLDAAFHIGDLVGYAPWPNEVVERVRGAGIPGVAGNYDSTVASGHKHCGCRYEDPRQEALSHESYAWTRAHVSDATKAPSRSFRFASTCARSAATSPGPTLMLVHGTPLNNTTYWTEDRPDAFCLKMAAAAGAQAGDLIAFGHTHQAVASDRERRALREYGQRRAAQGWRLARGICARGHRCNGCHRDRLRTRRVRHRTRNGCNSPQRSAQ